MGFHEKLFLETFFAILNDANVRYAVLRNYENLPESTGGSDLDILLHPDDEQRARAAINKFMDMVQGVVIGCAAKKDFLTIGVLGYSGKWWGVFIDIYIELRYASSAQLIDVDVLNDRFDLHNGIRIIPERLSAVLGVLKMLLHRDELSTRYLASITDLTLPNWMKLWVDMWPIGKPAFHLLHDICHLDPSSADVLIKSRMLRRMVLKEEFTRAPLTYIRNRIGHTWFKIQRFLKPPGLVIAVLGTDGVGKSTIISAIEPILSAATHGGLLFKHLRPGLLPPLALLKKRQAQQRGPVTDPHGLKPSGLLGSFFRLFYLMADYILGYWLVIRPYIAKKPAIVLFDRYAYDMALDPLRFRISLKYKTISSFFRFIPKPDLIVCLHGDPKTIAMRKEELPVGEVVRQTAALMEFATHEPCAVLVSNEGTVEQTREAVLTALQNLCSKKNKGCLLRDV